MSGQGWSVQSTGALQDCSLITAVHRQLHFHDDRVLLCQHEVRTLRDSLESRHLVQGISGGVKAAKAGHEVIMTPTSHCYFDYRQSLK